MRRLDGGMVQLEICGSLETRISGAILCDSCGERKPVALIMESDGTEHYLCDGCSGLDNYTEYEG